MDYAKAFDCVDYNKLWKILKQMGIEDHLTYDSVTPQTAACQASLSITNSWDLLKFMSIELVMPSNHLILCHPLLLLPSIFPASGSFKMSHFFTSGSQNIRVSPSASILPMNIQA